MNFPLLNLHTLFYTLSFSHSRGYFPAVLRFESSISHFRGYFPGRLYDPNLHFLIPGGTFPGALRFKSSFPHSRGYFPGGSTIQIFIPHSRGYFPGQLYDSYLHFLILGGIFPGNSTIQIFISSFQGVFPRRLYDSYLHFLILGGTFLGQLYDSNHHFRIPGGIFPGQLYDSNLHFLILGGIFPGNSTIHISIYSFQGVLSQGALRFKSSFPHSRGYFPGQLYDSNLQSLIPGGTLPGALRFKSSFPHSRGYFPGQLYDSNLHFLILGGTSPADSTIQIDKRFFPRVLPQLCLDIGANPRNRQVTFPRSNLPVSTVKLKKNSYSTTLPHHICCNIFKPENRLLRSYAFYSPLSCTLGATIILT